jgi:peptidoglycan/LPS O-acetylase OafA/YrhL
MRIFAILACALALLASLVWLANKPGLDSGAAVAAAFAAFMSSFFLTREKQKRGQAQHVSESSIGIQAGRDANVRDIKK